MNVNVSLQWRLLFGRLWAAGTGSHRLPDGAFDCLIDRLNRTVHHGGMDDTGVVAARGDGLLF